MNIRSVNPNIHGRSSAAVYDGKWREWHPFRCQLTIRVAITRSLAYPDTQQDCSRHGGCKGAPSGKDIVRRGVGEKRQEPPLVPPG